MTAVVQTVATEGLGNATSYTFTISASADGNSIVIKVAIRSNGQPITGIGVTDNKSNVYTPRAFLSGESGGRAAAILDCINAKAGVTSIVVKPLPTASDIGMTGCMDLQEVSGILGVDQVQTGALASGSLNSLALAMSATDSYSQDYVAAAISVGANHAAQGISDAPTGYTSSSVEQNDSTSGGAECCYRINSSAVTDSITWAISAGGTATDPAVMVSYQGGTAAGGAATNAPALMTMGAG
jgi:hypothetical protein